MSENSNKGCLVDYDAQNPYAKVSISELPQWWQKAIKEHREYGLREYKPPRFNDDVLKFVVVNQLERSHNVAIDFVKYQAENDNWMVRIDKEPVEQINRQRVENGYTKYDISSYEFKNMIENQLDSV